MPRPSPDANLTARPHTAAGAQEKVQEKEPRMMLFDVYVPRGALDADERRALGRRLIEAFMVDNGMHASEVLGAARTLTQALVHETDAWVLGQRPEEGESDPADPPRYVVRLSVPAAWRKDMSANAIEMVTKALAETEEAAGRDPEHLWLAPHAMVHVVGVSEGGIGFYGKSFGAEDLLEELTRAYRRNLAQGQVSAPPPGRLLDPVCGMTVEEDTDLTLVHGGTVYGFCHHTCRRRYAEEHGLRTQLVNLDALNDA
ncbi:hypothetical protein [Streptomyces sp. NPDC048172]|uniref:hypothetical protein n=1 Tax=Streptomyces sp. NPDC048172 TaxID=3365505 RepID=UPI003714286B